MMKNKKGIISIAVIVVLMLAASIAVMYWKASSQELFTIFREGEKLKAVNLAESGLNYAVSYLKQCYSTSQWPVKVPSTIFPAVTKKFSIGYFTIESISIVDQLSLKGKKLDRNYTKQPYVLSTGVQAGYYDLYQVTVYAKINSSGTAVRLTSLVKTIQLEKQ